MKAMGRGSRIKKRSMLIQLFDEKFEKEAIAPFILFASRNTSAENISQSAEELFSMLAKHYKRKTYLSKFADPGAP
jgi:hypothetical protein